MAKRKAQGFFALDIDQFFRIQQRGYGVEEAATYLALMKGTDQTNTVTSGGINSVTNYTGLTKSEAKKSVQNLAKIGLVDPLEVRSIRARTEPRYKLPIHDKRAKLAPKEVALVDALKEGRQPEGQSEINAAHRAASKGWIERRSTGWAIIEHANQVAFIPNSFVHTKKGDSPLARLVTTGEIGPIMLAAELYELQNLMEDRGVSPEVVRGYFHSAGSERVGLHQWHYLRPGRVYLDDDGEKRSFPRAHNHRWKAEGDFWENLNILDANHVIEWAVYSTNGKPRDDNEHAYNRPQRPLGVLRNGRHVLSTPELRPAFMTYVLALLDGPEGMTQLQRPLGDLFKEWRESSQIYAVENASVPHIEGVSILRMAHRAQTDNATQWYRELCQECDRAFFFIDGIIRENFPEAIAFLDNFHSSTEAQHGISM